MLLVTEGNRTRGQTMTQTVIDDEPAGRAKQSVQRAYKAMDVAVEVLESALDAARARRDSGEDDIDILKDLKDANAAFMLAMQVQGKARDAGHSIFGTEGQGQLDLDAARAEIGIRLACLRDAGDGGGVSGGVE